MKRDDLSVVLHKIDELRALMVFSQRTLPFLEDVFTFVKEIVPLLEVLKNSVESTSEKLPRASHQLNKVTTATELASTEILNIVEGIAARTEHLRSALDARKARVSRILDTLETLPPAAQAHAAFAEAQAGVREFIPGDEEYTLLESMQSDCTNIMIALQVQDITAQQIASVNELMQSVDEGLNRLMRNFHTTAKHDAAKFKHQKLDIVFDTSAEYVGGEDRQRIADALIEESRRAQASPRTGNKRSRKK
jgi:chemotaxis regulatin CheY-phosphate phosphatase CheZ